jgi:hypothetical protein
VVLEYFLDTCVDMHHPLCKAFKSEISTISRILYARSRDIVGPNSHFIGQSGTFSEKYNDYPATSGEMKIKLLDALFQECFPKVEIAPARQKFCRFLGSHGSHDLSLMREALGGPPEPIGGVSVNEPLYSAIFHYRNQDGSPFAVTYESGIDNVPRFDAHLAVHGQNKTVSIHYDTPYVKGLRTKVRVDEMNELGHAVSREIVCSFQDAFTSEFMELYRCLHEGNEIKTNASDAYQDLKLFDMMYKKYEADLRRENNGIWGLTLSTGDAGLGSSFGSIVVGT